MRRSDIEEIENLLGEDPMQAVAVSKRIAEETPEDADVWAWLAEAQIEAGDDDGALRSLATYILNDPEWLEAYTMRANLLTELGRFDQAAIELEVARAVDSEDPRLLRAEALHAELQGKFDEADDYYRAAGELDPAYPPPARFDRAKVRNAVTRLLRDAAKQGLKLAAVFEEIPTKGGAKQRLSRGLELRDSGTLVVYVRNLERELEFESELDEFEALFEERLAELVEAN